MHVHRPPRVAAAAGATVLLGLGMVGLSAAPAMAASHVVTDTTSLVNAITAANLSPEADVITFDADITLTADLPVISTDLEIDGDGHTLDGAGAYEAIRVGAGGYAITIRDITVRKAVDQAVEDYGADLVLDAVIMEDSGGAGVYAEDGSLEITSSRFESNGREGVYIDGADPVSIETSVFTGNDRDGISFETTASDATVTIADVVAEDNGGPGVWLDLSLAGGGTDARVRVERSTANDNGDWGLFISAYLDGDIEVSDVTANDNDFHGVRLDLGGPSTTSVSGLSLARNSDDGLAVDIFDSATLDLEDVTATDSVDDDGVDISANDQSRVTATGITATGNDDEGIEINVDNDARVEVSDSVAEANGDHGVDLDTDDSGVAVVSRVDAIDNDGDGYGVEAGNDSRVTIAESTIADNGLSGIGANIEDDAQVLVRASTVARNPETGIIGVLNPGTLLELVNSTVSGNGATTGCVGGIDALGPGGGLLGGSIELRNSTVFQNVSVGACSQVSLTEVTALVSHSIVAGATLDLGIDAAGVTALTVEHSLVGATGAVAAVDAALAAGAGNLVGVDPLLGALSDNGGPTFTHLPAAGSPVIDAGSPTFSGLATDQRGRARVQGAAVDLGAVEVAATAAATLPPTGAEPTGLLAGAVSLTLLGAGLLGVRTLRRRVA